MIIKNNLELDLFNSYHLHSIVRNAFFPESLDDILSLLSLPHIVIIGGGCNIILSKPEYSEENFVFIRDNYSGIERISDTSIRVKAGTDLKYLSEYALENELSGLEYFYDIPGCVGGATIMNAGCQGVSFSDSIDRIIYLDIEDSLIKEIAKEDAKFEYRGNIFSRKKVVILEVVLNLRKGEKGAIKELMISNQENRWKKQPREFPSAGSVFKRPAGHYVGPMVTEAGLKGYIHKGAMVSDKHAGFIINKGDATGQDIVELINIVRGRVKEMFNVDLEVEQRII